MELEEKQKQINAILDGAEAALQALGVPYFMAAVDRDTRDADGGKVFVVSDVKGQDMQVVFKHAFPANKDIAALGIWVGGEIMRRNKEANIKFRDKRKKPHTDKCNCKDCVKARTPVSPEEEAAATAEADLENLRYRVRMARVKATKKGKAKEVKAIYNALGVEPQKDGFVTYENAQGPEVLNDLLTQLTNIFNN